MRAWRVIRGQHVEVEVCPPADRGKLRFSYSEHSHMKNPHAWGEQEWNSHRYKHVAEAEQQQARLRRNWVEKWVSDGGPTASVWS